MESQHSQLPLKLIAAARFAVESDSSGGQLRLKLIAAEDNCGGNEKGCSELRLKLIVERHHPEGNEIRWKIIATEADSVEQIRAEIH
jgi:hypothetical protein